MPKIIDLEVLDNFKTRQDEQNDGHFLKRSNVSRDGNDAKIVVDETDSSKDLKVLTPESIYGDVTNKIIDISHIPASAREYVIKVANQAARYALTKNEAQKGDVVHEQDTGLMFFVVDDNQLNKAAGYQEFTAGTAATATTSTYSSTTRTSNNTAYDIVVTSHNTDSSSVANNRILRTAVDSSTAAHSGARIVAGADATASGTVVDTELILGNNISSTDATNFAKNRRGRIALFNAGGKYTYIQPNTGTANTTVTLPSETGILALTSSDITGNANTATTASKLSNTAKIGDTNKPVYFTANGIPAACSYTLGKSVPSDAVFTDTTYSAAANNAISLSGTTFSHSTAAGYKHIPTGGSAGQTLIYGGSSGTAAWGTPATTTKLETARAISLSGGATGSANFDGSEDISIEVIPVHCTEMTGGDSKVIMGEYVDTSYPSKKMMPDYDSRADLFASKNKADSSSPVVVVEFRRFYFNAYKSDAAPRFNLSGYAFYRKWSDGWITQGGVLECQYLYSDAVTESTPVRVMFPVAFKDKPYVCFCNSTADTYSVSDCGGYTIPEIRNPCNITAYNILNDGFTTLFNTNWKITSMKQWFAEGY